jgi:MoxR-like ATPase
LTVNEKMVVPGEWGRIREAAERFTENVGRVLVGKEETIRLIFVALLCESHVLIEDIPGIGKTLLARAAARSLACSFRRIQCTPDLLPSDIMGLQYFNQKTCEFEFRPGPIMANIVLIDEINRAMPRTQSALLECMQERQITVDLATLPLPRPFLILATQNPIELEGTFPLPEAQLDRFLLQVGLGYPSADEESAILRRFSETNPLDTLESVLAGEELLALQKICQQVFVEPSVAEYLVALARATRMHPDTRLGASPRASLGIHHAARALAAIQGRGYVIPDDIKALAVPVLAHRLILKPEARLRGRTEKTLVEEILEAVPVPAD